MKDILLDSPNLSQSERKIIQAIKEALKGKNFGEIDISLTIRPTCFMSRRVNRVPTILINAISNESFVKERKRNYLNLTRWL